MANSSKSRPALAPVVDGATYPLKTFQAMTGLGDWGMRKARRAGLKVVRQGSRAFVRGADWSEFLASKAS